MGACLGRWAGKLNSEQFMWVDCSGAAKPIFAVDVVGAVTCDVVINGKRACAIVDTGSGISLISLQFALKNGIPFSEKEGPCVEVANGAKFKLSYAADVLIELLNFDLRGICWVQDGFRFDILLGVDYLRCTPFMIDFEKRMIVNPRAPRMLSVSYLCMRREDVFDDSRVSSSPPRQSTRNNNHESVFENEYKSSLAIEPVNEMSHEEKDLVIFDSKNDLPDEEDTESDEEIWVPAHKSEENSWPLEKSNEEWFDKIQISSTIGSEERFVLRSLLIKYSECFPTPDSPLGGCTLGKIRINTGDSAPVKQSLRKFDRWKMEEINKQVHEMLRLGVISPCPATEWASNIVCVKKKDGTVRIAIDYRDLNKGTKRIFTQLEICNFS